jgi:MFS family permease
MAAAISHMGTQVTTLVIPLLALNVLGASTFQVSVLGSLEFAPFLVFGLLAGVYLDRRDRRKVMLWCDLARVLALGVVPVAWALGRLDLPLLCGSVLAVGIATVFFDVAAQSLTPDLVASGEIEAANQALSVSDSVALTAGPSLGGVLLTIVSAPVAIIIDVVSYAVSFVLLVTVPGAGRPDLDAVSVAPPLRAQISEGLAFVRRHRTLRPIVVCATTANLFAHIQSAVFVTYMVRTLHYSSGVVAAVFTAGNLGVLLGATQSRRISGRFALGRTLWMMPLIGGLGMLLIPLAPQVISMPLIALGWLVATSTSAVFNIAQLSYRQAVTPTHLRGRMNATVRTFLWGAIPIGYLVGGWLGTVLGVRPTMLLAGVINLTPFAFIRFSPTAMLTALSAADAIEEPSLEPA